MNTKIGTTFGLALLMAIAVIATMFALGMFSTTEVRADDVGGKLHGVTFRASGTGGNARPAWTGSARGGG